MYFEELEESNVSIAWGPAGRWTRVHGNGKSVAGGQFHIETLRESDGRYLIKIVGAGDTGLSTLVPPNPPRKIWCGSSRISLISNEQAELMKAEFYWSCT